MQIDPKKPVLIVGKGPSAAPVEKDDPRIVCALNGSVRLCERPDWLFVNDYSALEEIPVAKMATVENVVIPSELHLDTRGRETIRFDRLPNWFMEPPAVHLYQLPSAKRLRFDIPDFGRVLSVGETAVAWMLHLGYRTFETMGIDPEGGYHEAFKGGLQDTGKRPDWYQRNWRAIEKRVRTHGGTIIRRLSNAASPTT